MFLLHFLFYFLLLLLFHVQNFKTSKQSEDKVAFLKILILKTKTQAKQALKFFFFFWIIVRIHSLFYSILGCWYSRAWYQRWGGESVACNCQGKVHYTIIASWCNWWYSGLYTHFFILWLISYFQVSLSSCMQVKKDRYSELALQPIIYFCSAFSFSYKWP